jgi:CHASE3 domain sensor protein/putative methionine-R-sulfoxide reductase with GAF domain
MIKRLKENFITASLTILLGLLIFNTGLIFYNRFVMIENNTLQKQTEEVRRNWTNIFERDLRLIDLGLRGYALTRNQQLLDPYHSGFSNLKQTIKHIDSLLVVQKLDTLHTKFSPFSIKLNDYLVHSEKMRAFAEKDSLKQFVRLLNQDKGYDLWKEYSPMLTGILRYQDDLLNEAKLKYQSAMNRNVIFQIILLMMAVPTIISVIYRIRRDTEARKKLLLGFEESNRKYMFHPGTDLQDENAEVIISNSVKNLQKASAFIKSIAGGDYAASWEGLNAQNSKLNQDNLSGDLIKMRDQMKKVKDADEKRIWSTEGLARFSEVARNNQNNIEKLSNEVIQFLTKHMKAQQGSLFLFHEGDGEESSLQLAACYAFDRKKYINKRIEIGYGLIGQAFLEKETIMLTKIPEGYISITSGLGGASPTCLIIVPMKSNGKVEAILEMASFNKFEPHEIEFLEKAGEVIASSINTTKTNERTSKLLAESQQQAEALKAQEEELRQNMEEMQATQESMRRVEKYG